ncbi:MAG: glycerol-3-phosphate acyltransferase [Streptosporangiaceae bacterium]
MKYVLLAGILIAAYLAGAIPVSNIVARRVRRVDLRQVGSGASSPSNLFQQAGLWPTVAAGLFEVGKGAVGPALATGQPLWAVSLAGFLAVAGHNWSPFLKGGGGRGLSTATGALAIVAWPGAVLLCAGLAGGAAARHVYIGMSVALAGLIPLLYLVDGTGQAIAGAVVVLPIGAKTVVLMYRRHRDAASEPAAGEPAAGEAADS